MIEKTADWTLHPIAERELAEERRHRLARRRTGWLLAIILTNVLPFSCLTFFVPAAPYKWVGYVALAATAICGLEYYRRVNRNIVSRRERRAALESEYQTVRGGWIVDLTIYQGTTATGRDQGLLWFEDGRLIFSGSRTSFALAAKDVAERREDRGRVEDIRSSVMLTLLNETPAGKLAVGFDVVPSAPKSQSKLLDGLPQTIDHFRAESLDRDTQWPPLVVGPSLGSSRMLLIRAVASTAFWLYTLDTVVGVLKQPALLVPLLIWNAIVVGLCPELWFPHVRWRAFRDRLRLDRSLRQNNQQ